MNATAQIEPAAEAAKLDLIEQVDADPKLVLLGKVDFDAYLAELRATLPQFSDDDISTKAGRDAIVSRAASIRSRKATFEKTKLALTEHWRKQTAAVNAKGKVIAERMGALAEEIRAPVTAWEQAEEQRKAEADRIILALQSAPTVTFGMTSAEVQDRLERIRGMNLNSEILGVRLDMAEDLKADAVAKLTEAVASLKHQEQQAAELERLRAEQAAAEERRQREEQERAAAAARESAAKAEQERLERAKAEAAERARREAEEAERRKAQQAIDEANARAEEAERAKQAELDRIAREEADRKAAEQAAAEEQRRREADIAHRQQVIETAAEALTKLGLTKKLATAVVNEIASGTIPNVQVVF